MAEKQQINTRVQMYTTMEPLDAKNVTYKGLVCVNKASWTSSSYLSCEIGQQLTFNHYVCR